MTPDLLFPLAQANVAGSAGALIVIALRKSARRVFGARAAYHLWALVPLAVAASFLPPRPVAFIPAPAATVAPATLVATAEQGLTNLVRSAPAAVTHATAAISPALVIGLLWAIGLIAMVAWLARRQWQFMGDLARGDAGPAVVGFFRPRIITPSDFEARFNARERTVVIAHERIHLARHDARINALIALTRCLCWFNPLVHLSAYLMRIDQELACDAAVIERHPKARAPYAQALLKAQLAARPLPLGCYWPAGTEHPLTERIAMLKNANPSPMRRIAGGLVVAALSLSAGYAAWAAAPAAAPVIAAPLDYITDAADPADAFFQPATAPSPDAAPASDAALAQAPAAGPAPDPIDVNPDGTPRFSAFVERYDGNSPLLIKGTLVRADWMTPHSAMWVYGSATSNDGQTLPDQLWRVDGGTSATLNDGIRSAFDQSVGSELIIRGYQTKDKSCDPTCRVNGRDVTNKDGAKVFDPSKYGPVDCTLEQVQSLTCPSALKASIEKPAPTDQEIAAALAKAGKSGTVIHATTSNSVKRIP